MNEEFPSLPPISQEQVKQLSFLKHILLVFNIIMIDKINFIAITTLLIFPLKLLSIRARIWFLSEDYCLSRIRTLIIDYLYDQQCVMNMIQQINKSEFVIFCIIHAVFIHITLYVCTLLYSYAGWHWLTYTLQKNPFKNI